MDDMEQLQLKTLKEKIAYWVFFVLGIVGVGALLWYFVRAQP
jgi:hypothetical protein